MKGIYEVTFIVETDEEGLVAVKLKGIKELVINNNVINNNGEEEE